MKGIDFQLTFRQCSVNIKGPKGLYVSKAKFVRNFFVEFIIGFMFIRAKEKFDRKQTGYTTNVLEYLQEMSGFQIRTYFCDLCR